MFNAGIAYIDFNDATLNMETVIGGSVSASLENATNYVAKIRKAVESGKTICIKNIHIKAPAGTDFADEREIFNGIINVRNVNEYGVSLAAVRGCGSLMPNARRVATAYISFDYDQNFISFNIG